LCSCPCRRTLSFALSLFCSRLSFSLQCIVDRSRESPTFHVDVVVLWFLVFFFADAARRLSKLVVLHFVVVVVCVLVVVCVSVDVTAATSVRYTLIFVCEASELSTLTCFATRSSCNMLPGRRH
jgi:hypothetical protein